MTDLERVLRETADELAGDVTREAVPPFRTPGPNRRFRYGVGVAATVVLVLTGLIVAVQPDDRRAIEVPPVSPTSTVPRPTTTTTSPPDRSLDDVVPAGGAIALLEPPDGLVAVYAVERDRPADSSGPPLFPSWDVVLAEVGADGRFTGVRIDMHRRFVPPWSTAYEMSGGEADGPDVTIGTFTGRWERWVGTELPPTFVAPIDADTYVGVTGDADASVLEQLIESLRPVDGEFGFAFDVPAGFVVASDGTGDLDGGHEWAITYSTPDRQQQLLLTTTTSPKGSLAAFAVVPEARQLEVQGRPAVLSRDQLVVEVSSDLRVTLMASSLFSAGPTDLDLLAIAEELVPLTDTEWKALMDDAPENSASLPAITMPMSCSLGSTTFTDYAWPEGTRLDPAALGAMPIGSTLRVTATPPEGTTYAELSFTIPSPSGEPVELATFSDVSGPVRVELTWDGLFDGKLAGPGQYRIVTTATLATLPEGCDATNVPWPEVASFFVPLED